MDKKSETEIEFRAISQGLGFHPFSDGLPYAPVSKTAKTVQRTSLDLSQGVGAVAAGPAVFVRPSPRTQQPLQPHLPSPVRVQVPVANPSTGLLSTPKPAQAAEALKIDQYGFVYLMKRILAYLIDSTLNWVLLGTGLSFALWNQGVAPDTFMNPGLLILGALFCLIFNWALITAQEISFGTSVGKRVFGLALRGSTLALFLRAFCFLPSFAFCGIGLVWGIFDRKRRCWHDLVVHIQPIERARL